MSKNQVFSTILLKTQALAALPALKQVLVSVGRV